MNAAGDARIKPSVGAGVAKVFLQRRFAMLVVSCKTSPKMRFYGDEWRVRSSAMQVCIVRHLGRTMKPHRPNIAMLLII